jgi:hypothetical protein
MSDKDDWEFAGDDDAGSDRGDIVVEVIEIVREVAQGLPPNNRSIR